MPVLLSNKATPNFNHSSPQARVGAQFLGSSCSGEDLDLGTSPILTALQNVCNWVDGHIYPARAKQTSHASTSGMNRVETGQEKQLWHQKIYFFGNTSPILQG